LLAQGPQHVNPALHICSK